MCVLRFNAVMAEDTENGRSLTFAATAREMGYLR